MLVLAASRGHETCHRGTDDVNSLFTSKGQFMLMLNDCSVIDRSPQALRIWQKLMAFWVDVHTLFL